jgi:TonB family protein
LNSQNWPVKWVFKERVYINFVIEKNGKVSNVTIARGVDKLIDDEAIRVIKLLPKFIPAKQRGKPVRMQYTVPINAPLAISKESNTKKMPGPQGSGISIPHNF